MEGKIKVTFERLYAKRTGNGWGPVKWKLKGTIDGANVGNANVSFAIKEGGYLDLAATWAKELEIDHDKRVVLNLEVKEENDSAVGQVQHELRWPFHQGLRTLHHGKFALFYRVEMMVFGRYGLYQGNEVYACREHNGNQEYTTIAGAQVQNRVEVCEVLPLPVAVNMPGRLTAPATLPGRIPFHSDTGKNITTNDPVNVLPNPPVIPILTEAEATTDTAARIQITFFQPASLKLDTEKPERLEWTAVNLVNKPNVKFVAKNNHGPFVHVYGQEEGEVRLELRFEGTLVAVYRALVKRIRRITTRVTFLDGGAGARPATAPGHVVDHIRIANRFLKPAGILLVLDSNDTATDGAVKVAAGIFKVTLAGANIAHTRNVPDGYVPATRYNYRASVLNLVYIHSAAGGELGRSVTRPLSTAAIPAGGTFPRLKDDGTPSTSWVEPSGVWPHGEAKEVTIELMDPKVDPVHGDLWGIYITNVPDNDLAYGNTIAHEVGHLLGLCHREVSQDLIAQPPDANLMHGTNGPMEAQDLDIIQAKAVFKSPVLA